MNPATVFPSFDIDVAILPSLKLLKSERLKSPIPRLSTLPSYQSAATFTGLVYAAFPFVYGDVVFRILEIA